MKLGNWIIGIVIVIILIGGGWYYMSQQQADQSAAADTGREATVRRGMLLSTVRASGSIEPESQVSLNFSAVGTVAEVNVKTGQQVKAGETLAKLDTVELELAVAQAEKAYLIQQVNYSLTIAGPKPEEITATQAALASAWAQYSDLKKGPKSDQLAQAEAQLVQARTQYQAARDAHEQTIKCRTIQLPNGEEKDVCPGLGPAEERARAQEEAAQASLDAAQAAYDRVAGGASSAQLTAAWAQVQQAQANVARLAVDENRVKIAKIQMEQAKISLEQARQRIKNAAITAPFDGIVTEVNLTRGALVSAGGLRPAIVLTDLSRFHITVNVDEIDVGRLQIGQAVSVTVDALPGSTIRGAVEKVAAVATIEGAVVSYKVEIALRSTDLPLRAGMSANISIVTESRQNVLLVPNWAIRIDRETGKTFVNLKRNGTVTEVEITTGVRNENDSELLTGLVEGDIVITGGVTRLTSQAFQRNNP